MNWGHKIVITFVVFAAIIISMVVISMRQDVSLVAPDYYKQEIAYTEQMNKLQNTKSLGDNAPQIKYDHAKRHFVITSKEFLEGELHFYRPSDSSKDIKVGLSLEGEPKTVDASNMISGLWKVKLSWAKAGKSYFTEKNIVI
ncbi:FixH family protein [Fulvivirga lutimaris]|uniref:FixH family protein n=1 Tax=Fulvivirga lutimaris TaxID=1819566 RepID=UPI0012BCB256|nr:FixH family protein [Fulvivirga lutimaris]MTI38394.1 nitrogen fixation protein FixH [Fulvivirga lutimaris]